jgi:hypothetical protein
MTKSCRMIKLPSFAMTPNFLFKYSNSFGSPPGRSPVKQQKTITMRLFWFVRIERIFLILEEQVLD